MPDCDGICGGPGIYGNLNGDTKLDTVDVFEYDNLLESNTGVASTCNDLNGDGSKDMVVNVKNEEIVYLNKGEQFEPITPEERARLDGRIMGAFIRAKKPERSAP